MTKLRRILALVLVMAMTFTMLPTFAAADDAVSEVTAVEDVAVIPDAAAPEAPAVENIETAPTEAVAALQDVAADDVAMVIDYNTGTETGYASVKAAYQAAGQIEGTCEVLLLKDVTYVLTSGSSATSGFLNGTASTKANYKSWNMENYMDSEVAVNGFWLDLGGHTITVRCPNTSSNNAGYYNPAFFLGDSIPLNVKNGTIIYKYARTTQSSGFNLVSLGYAGSSSSSYAIGTADDLYTPSVTLKDVNFFRVHNGGDLSGSQYSNAGPVIGVAMLASNINLIRSDIFSTGGYAINYSRNTYKATAPEGTTATTHNLTIEDSRIATGNEERAAINAASIATSTGLALEKVDLNVTLKGAAQFIGTSAVAVAEGGPTLNFAQAEQLTASSTVFTVPDVASLATISATSNTAPANLPPVIYDSLAYFDAETHVHYPVEHAAVEATDTTIGVAAHWVCESCGTYYEADGMTETTFAALVTCAHTAKAFAEEAPATYVDDGMLAHWHCAVCDTYWAADGETVTTKDALVLKALNCSHANKTFVDGIPAKFTEPGLNAHHYCADCDTYWDAEGVNEIAKETIETSKRALTDTEGLVTDEDFAKLGAVVVATDPDGVKTVFTGNTAINDAYKVGASWTKAGGIVRLVTDFTHVDAKAKNAVGVINTGASTANAGTYEIADAADYPAGLNIKGFWLDLGGHTLVLRTGYAAFATTAKFPFNVRNGRIIHQFTTAQTSAYCMFKHGTTAGGSTVGGPEYTFDNVELIKLSNADVANASGGAMFYMNILQSKINIIDSKLFMQTASPIVQYLKGASVPTSAAYRHEVNIYGNTVLGTNGVGDAVFSATAAAVPNGVGDEGIFINVDEDANVIFLGDAVASVADAGLAALSKIPEGYVMAASKYSYALPDKSTLATETTIGAAPQDSAEETEFTMFFLCKHAEKTHVDAVPSTFADEGMAEHYVCDACGAYFTVDGVETNKEALTIPVLEGCKHTDAVHHPAVIASFTEVGMIEHWTCASCEKYFTDSALTIETTEDALALPVREWTDCEGLTDEQLVAFGAVAKTVTADGDTDAYETLQSAYEAAGAYNGIMNIVLLRDVVYLATSASYGAGVINGSVSTKDKYLSWNTDNTTDSELAVKGFWLDLNGHTVTVRCPNTSDNNTCYYRPAIYAYGSIPVNIKNGTVIYRYGRTTQCNGLGLISFGYGSSESNRSRIGNADELYTPSLTLKDANLIRVHDGGDFSDKAQKANTGPAIVIKNLASNVNIVRSNVISSKSTLGAIAFYKNVYDTTAPAGLTEVAHNVTIQDSRIGVPGGEMAIHGTSTAAGLAVTTKLNVTLKGAVQFLGENAFEMAEDGPVFNLAPNNELTDASSLVALPDVAQMVGMTNGQLDIVPNYLAPTLNASKVYLDATHVHVKEQFAAIEGTETTLGVSEHYACAACGTYWAADGETVINATDLLTCSHTAKAHVDKVPATFETEGFDEHWYCSTCGTYWTADGETETTKEDLVLAVLVCDHASKTFVEEVPATYTETGLAAHWFCSACETYWDADGVNVTTRDALILTVKVCTHAEAAYNEGTPATFIEAGLTPHWECTDCGKMFSDNELTNPVTAADLAIPVRATTDTEGLETDEDFAKLGAVAITIAPDGTKIAYTGNTAINDAYKYAATTWTEAGGVVRMVQDFTYVNAASYSYSAPFLNDDANGSSELSHNYENKDANEARFAGLGLKGFWFDLGGHTLTLRTGKSVFYTRASVPINIRNGRLIYQDTAYATSSYAMLKLGHTVNGGPGYDADGNVYVPEVTFADLTVIRVPHDEEGTLGGSKAASGSLFWISMLQSKLNFVDSTLINDDNSTIVNYTKAYNADTAHDAVKATPYRHEINLRGNVILGRTSDGALIYTTSVGNSTEEAPIANEGIHVNIADDANVKFLGTAITSIQDPTLAAASTVPQGYYASTSTYAYTLPDVASLATETTVGAGAQDMATATEFVQSLKAVDAGAYVTFTPNGGAEGAATTLTKAIGAWVESGYNGEIKFVAQPTADEITIANTLIDMTGTSYSTDSEALKYDVLYQIPAAASNGALTVNLNEYSLDLDCGFLGMDETLENFDLTIKNGTITSSYASPVVVLEGEGGCFKLDNAQLTNTADAASTNTILEARSGNAYAILTNSTISSAYRAALQLFTTSLTGSEDGRLFYCIKDCELSTLGGAKQPTINMLTSNGDAHRPATVILDGNTSLRNDQEGNFVSGSIDSKWFSTTKTAVEEIEGKQIHTISSDASMLTTPAEAAAVVTFAEISFPFAALEDAVEIAEAFGRTDVAATKLTLNKDVEVAESRAIGAVGHKSAFTMDVNGKTLSGKALIEANGGKETVVDITMVGELGNGAAEIALFAHAPAVVYAPNNHYVIDTTRYFTNYSLNLAENVSINLYTDGKYDDPDSVTYVQDGVDYLIETVGEQHDWVVDTLAAKEMSKTIDAYAVKTEGTTVYVDFVKGVSVKGYVDSDPASVETNETVINTLNATLKTMLVYGKLAEKYFAGDLTDLTANELAAIGLESVPTTDMTNLVAGERTVTGMGVVADGAATGFYGTSALLEDTISLKFYFFGNEFEGAKAAIGSEAGTVLEKVGEHYVTTASVSAKDIDAAVTVTITAADGETLLGTVTDSVEAYTARVLESETAYKLAQALRAYGADAKRFAEAKTGA